MLVAIDKFLCTTKWEMYKKLQKQERKNPFCITVDEEEVGKREEKEMMCGKVKHTIHDTNAYTELGQCVRGSEND